MWLFDIDWSGVEDHAPTLSNLSITACWCTEKMSWHSPGAGMYRSTSYAPYLSYVDLKYCKRLDDDQLKHIVTVCGETLTVKDYYGNELTPRSVLHLWRHPRADRRWKSRPLDVV